MLPMLNLLAGASGSLGVDLHRSCPPITTPKTSGRDKLPGLRREEHRLFSVSIESSKTNLTSLQGHQLPVKVTRRATLQRQGGLGLYEEVVDCRCDDP